MIFDFVSVIYCMLSITSACVFIYLLPILHGCRDMGLCIVSAFVITVVFSWFKRLDFTKEMHLSTSPILVKLLYEKSQVIVFPESSINHCDNSNLRS